MKYFLSILILIVFSSVTTDDTISPGLNFDFKLATSEFLTGRVNYYADTNFVEIPAYLAYRTKMYLLKDTYNAFFRMYTDAKKEGISLKIISATRTFDEQKNVWEDKWKKNLYKIPNDNDRAKNILQFSSMPGTSRHHWGTEIDLNSLSEEFFESGTGKKMYDWLAMHADTYGFCQTYSLYENRQAGYQEEKWHWSYYPISNRLLELYQQKVNYNDIKGFSGDELASELRVIDNYMLSVNNECAD